MVKTKHNQEESHFSTPLKAWYKTQYRALPWRATKDPYKIWLSEIILQQTRVAQGLPYYEKFISHYPTVTDLANAKQEEVLNLWQGLGYYSRARNLHTAAQTVVAEFNGVFPDNYTTLTKLKGVGSYTAAAIASFAFGEKVAVLDGNVFRVLSRFLLMDHDIADPKNKKIFQEAANLLLPEIESDIHNQAIMELGAMVCTPTNPSCETCPVHHSCAAFSQGKQSELPVKLKKVKKKNRYISYLVFQDSTTGNFLMRKRGAEGIWQGLYDFHSIEKEQPLTEEETIATVKTQLETLNWNETTISAVSNEKKHILTHLNLYAKFYQIPLKPTQFQTVKQSLSLEEISNSALESTAQPILIARYLNTISK